MSERKYSVAEIDRMRNAIEFEWLYGMKVGDPRSRGGGHSRYFREEEKARCVEEMLRTYLLAGIEPEELEYQPDKEEVPHV